MMRRITVALMWACGAAALAFAAAFFTPLIVGGPGAHQAPLIAFVLAPAIFVFGLILALVSPRLGLVAVAVGALYPAWYVMQAPPRDPDRALVSLTPEERSLIRSRHYQAAVAVDGAKFPPIYRANLIEDLGRTDLFTSVAAIEQTAAADLIASVTGSYYGDKTGHSFSLRWARRPERTVSVKVWYYASDGPFLYFSRHRLQVERLALEIIRQMDTLGPPESAANTP
jgi:hypothetical protein